MNIEILTFQALADRLKYKPDTCDVIYIGRHWGDKERVRDLVVEKAKDYLILPFDDVESRRADMQEPKKTHVMAALDWSKDRESIIVSCRAAIARSPAIAYVIKCNETTPEDALSVLSKGFHYPNKLVIKIGSDILQKPSMISCLKSWNISFH